ncbi:WD40 repeat-like protein [Ramicandelaber brevisporus]|nr:WD40 repeat-like protein [Ramicandelaber brevisporus]
MKHGTGDTNSAEYTGKLQREIHKLKQRIEDLERENESLRQSLFEVSLRYSKSARNRANPIPPSLATSTGRPHPLERRDTSTVRDVSHGHNHINSGAKPTVSGGRLRFTCTAELHGHAAAVYVARYSDNARLIASGSFDHTIRIWDISGSSSNNSNQFHSDTLYGHTLGVSDVAWSTDNTSIVSGSFDQTCRWWDVVAKRCTAIYEIDGFAQCVASVANEPFLHAVGTSRSLLAIFDRRVDSSSSGSSGGGGGPVAMFRSPSVVNSILADLGGTSILAGDAAGILRIWDIRAPSAVQEESIFASDARGTAITSIAPSRSDSPALSRYVAASGYDGIVRVYDRGVSSPVAIPGAGFGDSKLIATAKGHRNRQWPIKGSFLFSKAQFSKGRFGSDHHRRSYFDIVEEEEEEDEDEAEVNTATGNAREVQKLGGHTERVYSACAHPWESKFVTGSADSTLRIWSSI